MTGTQVDTTKKAALDFLAVTAQPVTPEVATFTAEFFLALHKASIEHPRVLPIDTGFYCEWRRDGCVVFFEVDEDSVLCMTDDPADAGRLLQYEDEHYSVGNAIEAVRSFLAGGLT